MQEAFWTVLLVVVVGSVLVALITSLGTGKLYEQIGRGGLSIDEEKGRGGGPTRTPAVDTREREDELRRLTRSTEVDPALREEIRQLVVARNERRARAGKPPLDVEEEVERQVRELG